MEFRLPELGEGVYEAEMVRWLVKPGDTVKPGQPLLEALTDKATMEVPAPFAGVIEQLLVEAGQKLAIGQGVLIYGGGQQSGVKKSQESRGVKSQESGVGSQESEDKGQEVPKPTMTDARNGEPAATRGAMKAAPSVRLMARKLGVDLAEVQGSGPAGRILVEDLSRHMPGSRPAGGEAAKAPAADYGKAGTRIKLQGLRRKIAEHMVLSTRTIPHYTYVDECDVSELVKLRESLKEPFAKKGAKITYLAFFVKAIATALKEVPIVNATLNDESGEIVLHDRYHIGIAVAVPAGLIVPVVRDADKKSLLDIAKEIERLTTDARAGKARLEDLRDGTFTITSIGNVGGLFATPIIHHPQVGILGVGKIVKRPIFDAHGQIQAADMIYLSWTFDHRVLDGAVAAAFGNLVNRLMQSPAAMMIG